MDSERINILSRVSNNKDTSGINFSSAISFPDEEGFTRSGSKLILEYLQQELGEDVPILIDFSAIPSSFRNDGKLADFITIFDPSTFFVGKEDLEEAFYSVYLPLQLESKGLFYHPDFFDSPIHAKFYYSQKQGKENSLIKEVINDYNKETWATPKLENGLVCYFKNKSFSISYDSFKSNLNKAKEVNINCQERCDLLLRRYNTYFSKAETTHAQLLAIPLIGYPSKDYESEAHFEGLGAIFVYFNKDNIGEERIKDIANGLWFLGLQITYNSIFQIAYELANRAKGEANKAAKAAIMSRNMSHNLGSHVMAYLKQHLSSVTNIIQDNVLAELTINEGDINTNKKIEDIALPFLVGVGNFISYLQERQDFIATIATDYIPYFAEVNFKDFIYDELNPDKRVERHTERTSSLKNDNILLGNIARSEGLGREIRTTTKDKGRLSDIVLYFRNFDGNPVVDSNGKLLSDDFEAAYKSLEEMRMLNVSLPGGVVGRQAIFSIVENVIRNAAKHGNWRNQGRLELTFDFFDKKTIEEFASLKQEEENLKLKKSKNGLNETEQAKLDTIKKKLDEINEDAAPITDSHPWGYEKRHNSLMEVLWLFYSKSIDADDLYFVTITDNIRISENAVKKLRDALIEDYIDDNYKLIEENKGIKELRISAAWLRGAKNEDEYYKSKEHIFKPQTKKKAPLVYVRQHYNCLQYIFCLQKPRTVAIVTKDIITLKAKKDSIAENWRTYTIESFNKESNKSFNFILCENQDVYDMIRPLASERTYNLESVKKNYSIDFLTLFKRELNNDECQTIEKLLYSLLVKPNTTESICIEDAKATAKITKESLNDPSYAIKTESYIEDKTKTPSQKKIINSYSISGTNVFVTDGAGKGRYLYRTHHDGANEFEAFMRDLKKDNSNYKGCVFVESITGNSSTDRLVRNDKIDFKWYYSHLHAMQQKVAIFDERLFAKIYGLEEVNFTKGAIDNNDLKKTKQVFLDAMLSDYDFQDVIDDCENVSELNELVTNSSFAFDLSKFAINKAQTRDRMAITYFQKGIRLFTLIRDLSNAQKDVYSLYGISMHPDKTNYEPVIESEHFNCLCVKLADLKWKDHSLKIDYTVFEEKKAEEIKKWESSAYLKGCFDYISIHQGLLDKLYEAFGIKEIPDDKIRLTNDFYHIFGSKNYSSREDGFIPGLIIHSGRSKPAKNDMPQKLPFIQYSAIEHSLMDCKYTLINLLDDARYDN